MITAQTIEQKKAEQDSDGKPKRKMHPASLANLVAPWTSENRPKSPGRPRDCAAELSRKVIEQNEEEIYKGLAQKAMAGDAYAFSVLSDRGYGKVTQSLEVKTELREMSEAELTAKLELLRKETA